MAQLPILEFPDPRLRTKAVPVDPTQVVAPDFQRLLDDMFETMYEAPGIGLAASQVDVHQRFMVIDVSEDKSGPQVFINPEILAKVGEQVYQEGCLSVPGIFADVTRADAIDVRFIDRNGQAQELHADGLLAVCIQHEMDHLVGKVFVDIQPEEVWAFWRFMQDHFRTSVINKSSALEMQLVARGLAGGRGAQGLHQPVGGDGLDQIVGCPGAHRLHRQQGRGRSGEHEKRQGRAA